MEIDPAESQPSMKQYILEMVLLLPSKYRFKMLQFNAHCDILYN